MFLITNILEKFVARIKTSKNHNQNQITREKMCRLNSVLFFLITWFTQCLWFLIEHISIMLYNFQQMCFRFLFCGIVCAFQQLMAISRKCAKFVFLFRWCKLLLAFNIWMGLRHTQLIYSLHPISCYAKGGLEIIVSIIVASKRIHFNMIYQLKLDSKNKSIKILKLRIRIICVDKLWLFYGFYFGFGFLFFLGFFKHNNNHFPNSLNLHSSIFLQLQW